MQGIAARHQAWNRARQKSNITLLRNPAGSEDTIIQYPSETLSLVGRHSVLTGRPPITPASEAVLPTYKLHVSDVSGVKGTQITNAVITEIVRSLNKEGKISFSIPSKDPQATLLQKMKTEVQVWRNSGAPAATDQHLATGVVFDLSGNKQSLQVGAPDPIIYIKTRHFGKADRTNYLSNEEFESGTLHWQATDVTTQIATGETQHMLGTKAVRLLNSKPDNDGFIHQQVFIDVGSFPIDMVAAGWYFTEDWQGPSLGNRGLYLSVGPEGGDTSQIDIDEITWESPRGEWTRLDVQVTATAVNQTNVFEMRLYGVQGSILWDACQLVFPESFQILGLDTQTVVELLLQHAQDPAFDKSDVNLETNTTLTGVHKLRQLSKYWDHDNMWSTGFETLIKEHRGIDVYFACENNDPTDRKVLSFYPKAGVIRNAFAITVQNDCYEFEYEFQGSEAASSVVALGQPSDAAREEGRAIDLDAFDGVTYEKVMDAPDEVKTNELDSWAKKQLPKTTKPDLLTLHLAGHNLVERTIAELDLGDIIPVSMDWGQLQMTAEPMRVLETVIRPQDDTVSIRLSLDLGE